MSPPKLTSAFMTLLWLLAGCASTIQAPRAPATASEAESSGKLLVEAASGVLIRRPPSSSGELDGDAVGWALFRASASLSRCYDDAGGEAAGRGVVYLLFDVEPSGELDRLTLGHSDIRGARFEACLRGALSSLELPPSSGRSLLQTHLVFGARDLDEGRRLLARYRASRARPEAQAEAEPIPLTGLRRRIQSCYERSLRGRPGVRGRMMLELTVQAGGQVSEASLRERGHDEGLNRCILGAVRNLRLEGDYAQVATLQYPVILQ